MRMRRPRGRRRDGWAGVTTRSQGLAARQRLDRKRTPRPSWSLLLPRAAIMTGRDDVRVSAETPSSPLDQRPDLRAGRVAHVDRGEPPGRLLEMSHRGFALAAGMQQVGHVRVQGRHAMLVTELTAELEGLGRYRQRLLAPARVG